MGAILTIHLQSIFLANFIVGYLGISSPLITNRCLEMKLGVFTEDNIKGALKMLAFVGQGTFLHGTTFVKFCRA